MVPTTIMPSCKLRDLIVLVQNTFDRRSVVHSQMELRLLLPLFVGHEIDRVDALGVLKCQTCLCFQEIFRKRNEWRRCRDNVCQSICEVREDFFSKMLARKV